MSSFAALYKDMLWYRTENYQYDLVIRSLHLFFIQSNGNAVTVVNCTYGNVVIKITTGACMGKGNQSYCSNFILLYQGNWKTI